MTSLGQKEKNVISINKFREIIEKSKDYLVVGIDGAKEKADCSFKMSDGKALNRKFKFEKNANGIKIFGPIRICQIENGKFIASFCPKEGQNI